MKNVRREDRKHDISFLVRFERKDAKGSRIQEVYQRFRSSKYGGSRQAKKAAEEYATEMRKKLRSGKLQRIYRKPSIRNTSGIVGVHHSIKQKKNKSGISKNYYWIGYRVINSEEGAIRIPKSFSYNPAEIGSEQKAKNKAIKWRKQK